MESILSGRLEADRILASADQREILAAIRWAAGQENDDRAAGFLERVCAAAIRGTLSKPV